METGEKQEIVPGMRRSFFVPTLPIARCAVCGPGRHDWVMSMPDNTMITIDKKYTKRFITKHCPAGAVVVLEATDRFDKCDPGTDDPENYRIWEVILL